MWDFGRHYDRISGMQNIRLAPDADFSLPIENMHQRVERRRMLTQLLAGIEREKRDVASVCFGDLPADDRPRLIIHGVRKS